MTSNQSNSDAKNSKPDPAHSLFDALEAAKKRKDAKNQNSDAPLFRSSASTQPVLIAIGILTVGLIIAGIWKIFGQPSSDPNLSTPNLSATASPSLPLPEPTNKSPLSQTPPSQKRSDSGVPPPSRSEPDRDEIHQDRNNEPDPASVPDVEPANTEERSPDSIENPVQINPVQDSQPQSENPQN